MVWDSLGSTIKQTLAKCSEFASMKQLKHFTHDSESSISALKQNSSKETLTAFLQGPT